MSEKLELEILTGPLDGVRVQIEAETAWTRQPDSPLSFPWDSELGEPQARFVPGEKGWQIEPVSAKRGTHLLRHDAEDRLPAVLQVDDVLKAGDTWLRVCAVK